MSLEVLIRSIKTQLINLFPCLYYDLSVADQWERSQSPATHATSTQLLTRLGPGNKRAFEPLSWQPDTLHAGFFSSLIFYRVRPFRQAQNPSRHQSHSAATKAVGSCTEDKQHHFINKREIRKNRYAYRIQVRSTEYTKCTMYYVYAGKVSTPLLV